MQLILPEVMATGIWKLRNPDANFLTPDTWYTCIAVRKIEDFTNKGIDAFKEFYETPYSITKEKFDEDVTAGGCIITVRNEAGDVKSFPSSYLESFPAGGGVAYQSLAIAIEIGAIPVSMNLELLLNEISGAVKDHVGVVREAKLVNLAPKELLDKASSERIEKARQLTNKEKKSPLAQVIALTKENELLKSKLREAEKWIIAKSNAENTATAATTATVVSTAGDTASTTSV